MSIVSQLTIRVVVSRCIEKTILWTITHQEDGGGSVENLTKELVEVVRDELQKADVLVQRKRRAIVDHPGGGVTLREVQNYLPANFTAHESTGTIHGDVILIEGYDDHGWTLHEYVIPRLSSGLIVAKEVSVRVPCSHCGHPDYYEDHRCESEDLREPNTTDRSAF